MKILLEWRPGPAHYRCAVFVGPDRDHLALAGDLLLRAEEAPAFRAVVRQGIAAPGFTGIFERGWDLGDE